MPTLALVNVCCIIIYEICVFLLQCQFHWTMVGAENLGMDFRVHQSVSQVFGSYKVVNTPADILLTCLEAI